MTFRLPIRFEIAFHFVPLSLGKQSYLCSHRVYEKPKLCETYTCNSKAVTFRPQINYSHLSNALVFNDLPPTPYRGRVISSALFWLVSGPFSGLITRQSRSAPANSSWNSPSSLVAACARIASPSL